MYCILWSPVYIAVSPDKGNYWGLQHEIWKSGGEGLKLRVPGSHRGGIEDDLRVITVVSRHHLARESGQSGGGWWLGHHGGLLGLEQEPGGGEERLS